MFQRNVSCHLKSDFITHNVPTFLHRNICTSEPLLCSRWLCGDDTWPCPRLRESHIWRSSLPLLARHPLRRPTRWELEAGSSPAASAMDRGQGSERGLCHHVSSAEWDSVRRPPRSGGLPLSQHLQPCPGARRQVPPPCDGLYLRWRLRYREQQNRGVRTREVDGPGHHRSHPQLQVTVTQDWCFIKGMFHL